MQTTGADAPDTAAPQPNAVRGALRLRLVPALGGGAEETFAGPRPLAARLLALAPAGGDLALAPARASWAGEDTLEGADVYAVAAGGARTFLAFAVLGETPVEHLALALAAERAAPAQAAA